MSRLAFLVVVFLWTTPVWAIQTNGVSDTTAPTAANIPNWNTGWPNSSVTGWNYVGSVSVTLSGAPTTLSGVYVGNSWVLTAAHVGAGTFTLGGVAYSPVSGSEFWISNGTVDLTLFQINAPPNLPELPISASAPVAFTPTTAGSSVAMLGFGGGYGLSWGLNTVTEINESLPLSVTVNGVTTNYTSNDFFTDQGTVDRGTASITNNAALVEGDSGGGDFIYNSTTQKWDLAGINEAILAYSGYNPVTNHDSNGSTGTAFAMVQLSTYETQISAIVNQPPSVDSPTMPPVGLALLAGLLLSVGGMVNRCNQRGAKTALP